MDTNIIRSSYPDVTIPDNIDLAHFMRKRFLQFGDETAMICPATDRKVTYKGIVDMTDRLITGLHKLGLSRNHVLGVCLSNCMEYFPLALASISLGAVFTTSNPLYTEDELVHHYNQCKVNFVVTNDETLPKVMSLKNRCPSIKTIINIGDSNNGGSINFRTLTKENNAKSIHLPKIKSKEDVAFYLTSSGTTGLPKAVMLTHYNVIANVHQTTLNKDKSGRFTTFSAAKGEPYLSVFPYYHVGGLVYGGLSMLNQGAILISLPKYDPDLFLNSIEKYKPVILVIPPPVLVFLTKSPLAANRNVSSIRNIMCGAAPIGFELTELTCKKFNIDYIIEGYGMTELSPMCHQSPVGQITKNKWGSCGVVVPNTMCKIVDVKNGKSLGPKQTGEVCIKGPQIMKGYLNNPDATRESIDKDGWMHTGDIAYYDEDHFFFIVDRIKELIKVKAFQV